MSVTAKRSVILFAVVSVFMALYSCSGSSAPQPGSPGFFWMAAKGTFDAADYATTAGHLDDLLSKDDGEYAARALPWALVLTSGMAEGYMEAADAYQKGVKANKTGSEPLRREMVRYHDAASRLVLQYADKFESFNKLTLDSVPLAFAFPKGSAAEVPGLLSASTGAMPAGSLAETALQQSLQRNVILAACKAVGVSQRPVEAAPRSPLRAQKCRAPPSNWPSPIRCYSMAEMFSQEISWTIAKNSAFSASAPRTPSRACRTRRTPRN